MERLTEERQIGPWASLKDKAEAIPGAFSNYDCLMAHMTAVTRLKDSEDTGLTPQEIASMRNTLGNIGATVYVLLQDGAIYYPETNGWYISEEFIGAISLAGFWLGEPEDGVYVSDNRIGKTVFFTREEAERALEEEAVTE